jgi:predicted DNA-binding protein with PD1-like motif
MTSTLLSNISERREWVLVFDAGDDVTGQLETFARREHLAAAHFSGIGAFSRVTVGWFDLDAHSYRPIEINEQVEVLSLAGDVADKDGAPAVHAHIVVAKRDGTAHGGHLLGGRVMPTLEVIVTESPAHLRKSFRPEFGIALIDLRHSTAAGGAEPPGDGSASDAGDRPAQGRAPNRGGGKVK